MSKTALVVDDSKSARFALRKYLENHGYQVEAVEGAQFAYEFLARQLPGVIFLDHIMPGIDGFEALQHIKNDPRTRDIPAVICSSNEGAAFVEEALAKGASAILQKPPRPDQLLELLTRLTSQPAPAAPAPVAAPEIPPAAPPKVTVICEPEIAIEQAVLKAVRSALPTMAEPPVQVPAVAAPAITLASSNTALIEADQRARSLSQDFNMQLEALRTSLAQLEGRIGQAAPDTAVREDVATLRNGLTALERVVGQELEKLQREMQAGFAAQTQSIEQLAQSVRQAAAEEAQRVAERAVMAAAARVSDQLAQSILQAFNQPRRSEA